MIQKFQSYVHLLLEWNQRIHLISRKDARADRILRHFIDSLCIFKVVDLPRKAKLLDLGSGAGFPSTPIKIVRNDIHLTLVESTHKKTLFLQKLIQELKLQKTCVINQRAEKLIDLPEFQARFDLVTAKALGRLKDVLRLSLPFLKPEGSLVAYKGRQAIREFQKVGSLEGFNVMNMVKIEVPEMDLLRYLVILRKSRHVL